MRSSTITAQRVAQFARATQTSAMSAEPPAAKTVPEPPAPAAAPEGPEGPGPEGDTGVSGSEGAPAGMFGGWGFDVSTVAGGLPDMGSLFGAEGDEEENVEGENGDLGVVVGSVASKAGVELGNASKAAQETIGKAREEIGKGWGTFNTFLDDILSPKADGAQRSVGEGVDVQQKFHELFPDLDLDDDVVDHYSCTLLQKYRCYLNNATPEKTFPLRGRLYVTTSHLAMYVVDDGGAFGGQPFGVSVPFREVGKIQKGAKAMLRLVTKTQTSYVFADFESDSHFSGALSLLEHMAGAAASPLSATRASTEETPTENTES